MSSCPFNLHDTGGLRLIWSVFIMNTNSQQQQQLKWMRIRIHRTRKEGEIKSRDAEIQDDDDGPCSSVLLLGFVRESVLFAIHYTNHPRTYHVLLSVNTPTPAISSNRVQFNSIHGPTDGQSSGCGFSPTCRIFTFVGPTFNLQGCTGRNCGYIYYSLWDTQGSKTRWGRTGEGREENKWM